jgi:hypothetical protein
MEQNEKPPSENCLMVNHIQEKIDMIEKQMLILNKHLVSIRNGIGLLAILVILGAFA